MAAQHIPRARARRHDVASSEGPPRPVADHDEPEQWPRRPSGLIKGESIPRASRRPQAHHERWRGSPQTADRARDLDNTGDQPQDVGSGFAGAPVCIEGTGFAGNIESVDLIEEEVAENSLVQGQHRPGNGYMIRMFVGMGRREVARVGEPR